MLLEDVMSFWQRRSINTECGEYLTCLDHRGRGVRRQKKHTWLQVRQLWTLATLYCDLERREDWLDVARHGAEFLSRHDRDSQGNWYYALDRQGRPLMQPFSVFSDGFAAMGFSALAHHRSELRQPCPR